MSNEQAASVRRISSLCATGREPETGHSGRAVFHVDSADGIRFIPMSMKTDEEHRPAGRCACGHAIKRRRFILTGSGGVLGALRTMSGTAAEKALPVDIGAVTKFAEDGISEDFTDRDFFVIRHQGCLFAASTVCPHMENTLSRDPEDPTRITCSGHGSVFDGEGVVMVGPASTGLTRLGITVNKDGHAIVDPNKQFTQDKWTDKGCYIEVE